MLDHDCILSVALLEDFLNEKENKNRAAGVRHGHPKVCMSDKKGGRFRITFSAPDSVAAEHSNSRSAQASALVGLA